MGKRIISQARGHGSLTYRVRKQAFIYKVKYPSLEGEAEIVNLIHSPAHTAPLIKVMLGKEIFYIPAFNNAVVGDKITLGGTEVKHGNILQLKSIPVGTSVYNIEAHPGDGGRFVRVAGSSATVSKELDNGSIMLTMPNRKSIILRGECRAVIGTIAGSGRTSKPILKAGRNYYKMKARNKLWPRTSAVKVNAIDHPFGSGRGKRPKSKIAKRNSPPGAKVGHIRPRRTGRRK